MRADLTVAMRERDAARTTLRSALAALGAEKVAGETARELTAADELAVLRREVRKRRESAEAFGAGNRPAGPATGHRSGRRRRDPAPDQRRDLRPNPVGIQAGLPLVG